jgi:hypothetical protein
MLCTSRSRPDDVAGADFLPMAGINRFTAATHRCLPRCADALSKGSHSCFGDSLVLFAAPAADADGAYYLACTLQRDSSRENHDPAPVGGVDSIELSARAGIGRQLLGRYVECTGSEGFVYRDVDAADPGAVHPNVRHQVAADVDDRDIRREEISSALALPAATTRCASSRETDV